MATLAPQTVNAAGLAASYAAATGGGDAFSPDDRTIVHVKNGGGSPITATFATPGLVGGLAIADATGSVPAGGDRFFGPFPASLYQDPVTNLCTLTYSGVTSVTVAVLRSPPVL